MTRKKLTPEEKPELSYDWNLLGYARVAQEYFEQGSEEGVHFAKKSLELILEDAKINDPWIVNTVTDPEVLRKTIESQLDTYTQFKKDQTIGDILDYYSDDLDEYIDGGVSKARKDLKKFVNEKYTSVISEINKAKHVLEGKKKYNIGSDEDVKKAEDTFKEYQKVTATIGIPEGLKTNEFKLRVKKELAKDSFKQLYTEKEEK